MDREDYTDKALSLLADTNTYKTISKDPTTKLKNKLSQTLRDIKNQGGLSDHSYRKVYLTSAVAPKFYGLLKIHKGGIPLRPIVSRRVHHIWSGQEAGQHHLPLGWSVPTPSQKHPTLHATHQVGKAGIRRGHDII